MKKIVILGSTGSIGSNTLDIVTKFSAQFQVDSEHSAIIQSLEGHRREDVRRLILTASGGPLWDLSKEQMQDVKSEQALKHPNWKMGAKITIDSATLMNKGLEVVKARWLFDIPS